MFRVWQWAIICHASIIHSRILKIKLTFCIPVTAFWANTSIVSDVATLIAIMTIHVSELSRKHFVLVKFNSLVINATAITFTPDIVDLAKQYNEARLDRPHLHHPVCLSRYKMLLQRVQRWVMRPVWVHVVHHHFVLSFSSCWFLFLILVNIHYTLISKCIWK